MKVKVTPKRKDCAARARRGDCEGGGPARFQLKKIPERVQKLYLMF